MIYTDAHGENSIVTTVAATRGIDVSKPVGVLHTMRTPGWLVLQGNLSRVMTESLMQVAIESKLRIVFNLQFNTTLLYCNVLLKHGCSRDMLSITRFIPGWAITVHTVLLATLMFTITLDVNAQASRETTTRTIAKPANDASLAIGADGIAYVAFTTTKVDGDTVSVTGVKAARCDDIACSSKSTFIQDEAGLGSPEFALDSSGLPIVAYVRQGDELRLAWCSNASCDFTSISVISMLGGNPSLALNTAGNPVISYKSRNPRRTKIAVCADEACAAIANLAEIPRTDFGRTLTFFSFKFASCP